MVQVCGDAETVTIGFDCRKSESLVRVSLHTFYIWYEALSQSPNVMSQLRLQLPYSRLRPYAYTWAPT